jgi:glycosyltransferase involved in cell wall biosynthesis
MAKVVIFTNVDWFFVSHRMAIACALRDAGLEVVVIAGESGAAQRIRAEGLRFVAVPLERSGQSPARELRTVAAVAAAYRRERPDIVQHASIKSLMYGSWVARALGIPVINTVNGLGYSMIERPDARLRQRVLQAGVKLGYRFAFRGRDVHNVFQNPDMLEQFVRLGLCERASTQLIRGSGVDTERFQPAPLPEGRPVVMVPARLLWDKGIGEFVEAARVLRARHVDARFVLVGGEDPGNPSGIPRADVERWVAEGVIEWWGHQDDMPSALRQATVVALPSYAEGMPLALAEGAAMGRAVITSDVPGCREAVIPGVTGWLVPARDARALATTIDEALRDREILARMGARGREHVEQTLSLRIVLREMLALYQRILGDRWPAR